MSNFKDGGIYSFRNNDVFREALININSDPRGDFNFADIAKELNHLKKKVIGVEMIGTDEAVGIDRPNQILMARLKYVTKYENQNEEKFYEDLSGINLSQIESKKEK